MPRRKNTEQSAAPQYLEPEKIEGGIRAVITQLEVNQKAIEEANGAVAALIGELNTALSQAYVKQSDLFTQHRKNDETLKALRGTL